jgi:hypothetical protein
VSPLWLLLLILSLTSCVQENNPTIELGDATIGQQLIDLKAALDGDAISEEEYVVVKANLIASSKLSASEEGD